MAGRIRRSVWFDGQVQGVGFRFTTCELAERFAVAGYVRNLRDGRVELVAEGDAEEVDRFIWAVSEAMRGGTNRLARDGRIRGLRRAVLSDEERNNPLTTSPAPPGSPASRRNSGFHKESWERGAAPGGARRGLKPRTSSRGPRQYPGHAPPHAAGPLQNIFCHRYVLA